MLLDLKKVQKQYGDFHLDVSMEIPEGQITGLIGANGAGKSTTIKAILGLIRPSGGEITLFDKKVTHLTAAEKERFGVVLSEHTFSQILTLKDIAMILKAEYKAFDGAWFWKKCEEWKLPDKKQFKDFSTGMKTKMKFLVALCHNADLLILDEPTLGMDAITRGEILDELREYMQTEGRGILITSHISGDLEGLCDDLYFLHDGKPVLHEDTDVLLSHYGILKVTEEQYRKLDLTYIVRERSEPYGRCLLTKERQYYLDNCRDVVVEKCTIDDMLLMLDGKG